MPTTISGKKDFTIRAEWDDIEARLPEMSTHFILHLTANRLRDKYGWRVRLGEVARAVARRLPNSTVHGNKIL